MEKRQKYVCSYDQAGNLVKTIPPAGAKPDFSTDFTNAVKLARQNNQLKVPPHTLATNYRYNTLNQVIAQLTPDAGLSKFFYDAMGRLAISQNAQQQLNNKYSYTLYDSLGRTKETGQLTQAVAMAQTIAQNQKQLADWLNNKPAEQITRTFYDKNYFDGMDLLCPGLLCQKNLRNRVSFTAVYATGNPGIATAGTHDVATYFSYDIKGGTDTILQDYNNGVMKASNNRFKKIAYDYDLISGKVNKVTYQPGQPDAFYHKYFYDAENRLTDVYTSKDSFYYERDSRYDYYKHGPLARQIIGQNQVQGFDYAYTLQGWLKGMNSTAVGDGKFDMGGDGVKTGNTPNPVALDAFGFALHYYSTADTKDYNPINANAKPFANAAAAGFGFVPLYNGNIAAISMNIPKLGDALLSTYRVDQLNRLVKVNSYKGLNPATNSWNVLSIDDYREELSYDANGNIQTYKRNGSGNNLNLNNYSYTYQAGTNKLISLKNAVDNKITAYGYDAIGNVTKDEKQNVLNNTWNVYGKLQKVEKKDGKIIAYSYDARGNRISKTIGDTTEIYVRDAAGNVMLTYQKNPTINSGHVSTKEFYKYGGNLLGIKKKAIDMQVIAPNTGIQTSVRGEDEYYVYGANGNIIGTVGDKKIQHDDDNDGIIDRYTADVRTATMFSSYGAMSKSFNGDSLSLAFNGQRKSPEISTTAQTAEFWEYNSDIGRRWNRDQVVKVRESPYAVFGNNPIWFSDYNGADTTLPDAGGKNLTLPTSATGISSFDGTVKDLQNSTVKVQPAAGSLSSFNINGKQFNAQFGSRSGSFQGYYSDDISYNDYAAQQAAAGNGSLLAGAGGISIAIPGSGAGSMATGSLLPAIPIAGFKVGWDYGATHADKVTSWVTAIASTVGGWLGEDVVADNPTAVIPTSPMVEQYALRARASGDYPVLTFGNAGLFYQMGAVTQTAHLEAGQVWKYGTTMNPSDRYSQTFLQKYNLQYQTEFIGPVQAAIMVESMKIVNHAMMYGSLPPGNTKLQ